MSIATFASGNGGNFQAIVERSRQEKWPKVISLLICDQKEATVLKRAESLQIKAVSLFPGDFKSKVDYEQAIIDILKQHSISWIVLAGYMRLVGPTLLAAYQGRIINIHPSLLPAFPGKRGIEDAFNYPVKISGITVHFVDAGIDTGPIIAQVAVPIATTDTLQTFTKKMHEIEHQFYPKVIFDMITGNDSQKE